MMANKEIADLTAAGALDGSELMHVVQGGNSRKTTVADIAALAEGGVPSGTSFPGSPATGQRFYRSDRKVEYEYDGVRWLSTQPYFAVFPFVNSPQSATGAVYISNPTAGLHDIYIETLIASYVLTNASTGANYFDFQLQTQSGAGSLTNLGTAISGAGATQNAFTPETQAINQVVASTVGRLAVNAVEVGAASVIWGSSIAYRLVG